MVENAEGDAVKADEAEERVTEELRKMGLTALQSWADRKNERVIADGDRKLDMAHKKKNLYWHSRYGRIEVQEQIYL